MPLAKRQTPLSLNLQEEVKEEKKVEEPKKVAPKKVTPKKVAPKVETPIEVAKPVSKRVNPLTLDTETKEVEVKEVVKEVIKYVEVPKEVIKEVEKIVEVPKEVIKYVDAPAKIQNLPALPTCNKNSFIIGFVRKDVMSTLKAHGGSNKDILNEAISLLLKEKYPEEYSKIAKGE